MKWNLDLIRIAYIACKDNFLVAIFSYHYWRHSVQLTLSAPNIQCPRILALGRKYFRFHEKQILHLALQNWNYFVNKLWQISRRQNNSLKIGGDILRYTLNISVANICRFLVCIETDLSCSNSSSKDDVLSPYIRRMHLSCNRFILLFIIRLWNIQIRGQ